MNCIEYSGSNPFRYYGEYFDKETGTIYLRVRYYNPGNGRFISQDSYMGNELDPLSLNLYIYCKGNPIMFIDPSGNWTVYTMYKNNGDESSFVIYDNKSFNALMSIVNAFPGGGIVDYGDLLYLVALSGVNKIGSDAGYGEMLPYNFTWSIYDNLADPLNQYATAVDAANIYFNFAEKAMAQGISKASNIIALLLTAPNVSSGIDLAKKDKYIEAMVNISNVSKYINDNTQNPATIFEMMSFIDKKLDEYGTNDYKRFIKQFTDLSGFNATTYSNCYNIIDVIFGSAEKKMNLYEQEKSYFNDVADKLYQDFVNKFNLE
ncbi:MAG: RHS repeat-associated core domain-containing protein [Clostridia bacterium]|nr:RHS repeat-associated core domain-containing protein [Clostridia bacterium]